MKKGGVKNEYRNHSATGDRVGNDLPTAGRQWAARTGSTARTGIGTARRRSGSHADSSAQRSCKQTCRRTCGGCSYPAVRLHPIPEPAVSCRCGSCSCLVCKKIVISLGKSFEFDLTACSAAFDSWLPRNAGVGCTAGRMRCSGHNLEKC